MRKNSTNSSGGGTLFSVVKAVIAYVPISVYQPSALLAMSARGDLSCDRFSSGSPITVFSCARRRSSKSASCVLSVKLYRNNCRSFLTTKNRES